TLRRSCSSLCLLGIGPGAGIDVEDRRHRRGQTTRTRDQRMRDETTGEQHDRGGGRFVGRGDEITERHRRVALVGGAVAGGAVVGGDQGLEGGEDERLCSPLCIIERTFVDVLFGGG